MPSRKPDATGTKEGSAFPSESSNAGISSDQTEAAVITPADRAFSIPQPALNALKQ